jgi:hypothetical protein
MVLDRDALNYPYIRVRDVNWLKRTLLLFPHVVRITPEWGAPPDEPEVAEFARLAGRRGPLLRSANLTEPFVWQAQRQLVDEIHRQIELHPQFLLTYDREATWKQSSNLVRQAGSLWGDRLLGLPFQLHRFKLLGELLEFLLKNKLAWVPERLHGNGYIEMHPRLGEAVMATLAHACAYSEGLQLVTEFPSVYGRTIRLSKKDLLSGCLSPSLPAQLDPPDGLLEFIFYQRCNPQKLTPARLQALNKEWEPIANFRSALEELAKSIPPGIQDQRILRSYLDDSANRVFAAWTRDQANLSSYVRELFGEGLLAEPTKALGKIAEKAVGEGFATAALVGGVTSQYMLGAAAGCAVGLIMHAARSYSSMKNKADKSPYRYLTMLHDDGVGFVVSA